MSLKHSITISPEDKRGKDYKSVAYLLWKAFKNSSASTKKILHFLLGEENEHKITEEGIRGCGLHKIYDANPEETMKQARIYLTK
jgi:hypothetical protein